MEIPAGFEFLFPGRQENFLFALEQYHQSFEAIWA
jgi:hypothetical protein